MKKLITSVSLIALTVFFSGCATSYPVGLAFTDVQLPVMATDNSITEYSKKGESSCESYLGLIAVGEASIEEAAKDGGITNITHIDWSAKNVLGVWGIYTITVYGE